MNEFARIEAPQNDFCNLSFVKEFHSVGKKMTRNAPKVAIYIVKFFMNHILVFYLVENQSEL